MSEDSIGLSAPIVSVRRGRNQLPDEDRVLLEERRRRRHAHQDGDKDHHEQNHGHGHGHDVFHDDVSVLGIPEDQMTEPVRKAIGLLLEEINHLRDELQNAKGHEAYLEDQAEKDRLLHVMRRRAFVARLNFAVRRVEEEHVLFCFLFISIVNAQHVRLEHGHGAIESLMVHAADVLRQRLEPGDIIGSLENFDFGIILPGTNPLDADQKGRDLVAGLCGTPCTWQGQTLTIQAQFGNTEIAPGDTGEDVIARGSQHMQARMAETQDLPNA